MLFEPVDVHAFVQEFLQLVLPKGKDLHEQSPRREFAAWTTAVKEVLAEMGNRRGVKSLYTKTEDGLHEFLLDFVWWSDEDGDEARLACECEFGNTRQEVGNPKRVAEDFDKLLSFKAPLKLMLFDSYSSTVKVKSTVEDVLAELNRYLSSYRLHWSGERYVLIDLCEKPAVWLCEINQDGRDANLKFEPLLLNRGVDFYPIARTVPGVVHTDA